VQRVLRVLRVRSQLQALPVWLHLLDLVEHWCQEHLERRPRAFRLLRSGFSPGAAAS